MRENLTLISTNKSITKDIDFIKEKITSTLEVIDQFLLNNIEPNLESHQIWCKNVELIKENKAENKNIIKINNDLYVFPQSLGEIDPSNFSSKEEFLSHYPEIKELKD